MYNILIVDDNSTDLERNRSYISKQFYENQIIVELHIADHVSKIDNNYVYDVIFLDIDIPDCNGFEIAKQYISPFTHIIFITNRDDLVYQSFEYQPFGYVRKNYYENDFQTTFDRLIPRLKQYIFIDSQRINLKDILYAESFGHNLVIHTQKKDYSMRYKLKDLDKLINHLDFYIINQSYLVNFIYVKDIIDGECLLQNQIRLSISRRKLKDVKKQYEQYIFRSI